MKKIVSFVLSLALVLSLGVFATFAAADRDEYLAKYDEYVTYYEGTYVPSYNSYNEALDAFSARIDAAKEELTFEQFEAVLAFLNEIKAERSAFYGDRETPGTSRYEVPFYRNAMFAAAEDEDYDLALTNRETLLALVTERVEFLSGLEEQFDDYDLEDGTVPEVPAISVDFKITNDYGYGSHAFEITLTNNSSAPVSDWLLNFTYTDGDINTFWLEGSSIAYQKSGQNFSIYPTNEHQTVYTISAGESIIIRGNGNTLGTSITNATFNGEPITMTFSK
ncbi:MAG: cellulose binding domain-containing protein [Eubacteriales bacterium]|nr:cellulose binding domain-containing protein [Eubacteriales bacterium]MDD4474793.1 cellulose binding domain-containing protein [Eubacteriales bacterium]